VEKWPCSLVVVTLFAVTATAQKVSGRVTDETGEGLPGVTVFVKGTSVGTVTDMDGRYNVAASQGQELMFSQTGMETQTVRVGSGGDVNVTLSGSITLREAVITGALGLIQDKRKLSYSAQAVKGEELRNTQRDNAFLALQGRIAGLSLTPTSGLAGGAASINLRGVNSIGNSNQPLIVMDGLPINSSTFNQHSLHSDATGSSPNINNNRDDISGRLAEINPNDIESISVLKGPEAAALYGNEGANGVIIITTKKGKAGSGRINYRNRFSTSEIYLFPEIQTKYGRGRDGKVEINDPDYFGPVYEDTTTFFNNVENFFQRGSSQRHDLSFEGGTERFTYRMSSAYVHSEGVIPTNKYDQMNAALSSEAKLTNWLKATSRFSYTRNANVLPPSGTDGYLMAALRYPSNQDMSVYLTKEGNRRLTLPNTTAGADNANPYFNVYKNVRKEQTDRTTGNISLEAGLTNWWSVTGRFGADIYTTSTNRFFHPQSNTGFTPLGWVENANDVGRTLNTTLFTTLKKSFGKIGTALVVGTSVDDRRNDVSVQYGERLYLPDFNSINNTDPTTQRTRATLIRNRLVGAYAKAEINVNEWLIFNLTGRNDWSSTLPVANRSYFYPSAGMTFNFSDLPSLKGRLGPLNFGKIRASFAQVGNPAPPYKIRSRLVSQTSTGGGFLYDFFGDNPSLKPETVTSYELGTELAFFKDRLTLDFAVFSKTIKDQIVTQRLSYGTGFIFGLLNGGELNTKGLEIQLGLNPVRRDNLRWNITANFTKYATKVLNLPANVSEYYDSDTWAYDNVRISAFAPADLLASRFSTPTNRFYAPLNSRGAGSATAIGGWSYLRNSKGDILIEPTTGLPILNQNFLPIGDRNPDFTVGLINEFRLFKRLNLSFMLDIRKGGDIFNGNELYLLRNGLSKKTLNRDEKVIIAGVLRDGKEETDTPTQNTKEITPSATELYYTARVSPEDFVERDINWMRLRDVTLSYDLPVRVLGNQRAIKEINIFLNGTDLFMITNYTGADPYVSVTSPATGGAGGFGIDYGKTSLPRTISAGLNVTF
jgi:TonB-linked SusC/RagA family outer membrane protein